MATRKEYDVIMRNAEEARNLGAMTDNQAQDYIRDKVREVLDTEKGKKK